MIVNVLDILSKQGNFAVARIQQNLAATGTNATSETSRSLRVELEDKGFIQVMQIVGKPYFMVVETGRKPTPEYKPSYAFVASIKKWADTKNIGQFAYAIARNIHKKGTKLWQQGGRQDIVTNVINRDFVEGINKELLTRFGQEYIKNAVAVFDGNRTN